MDDEAQQRPSFTRRAIAIVILAIVAWLLLKFIVGLLAGIATIVVVVLGAIGVYWAVKQF